MSGRRLVPQRLEKIVVGLVVLIVFSAVPGGSLLAANLASQGHQVHGSVAAPTAAEISPICDAPQPAKILGPSSNPPSSPTSTLITPPGGVVNFATTSSALYVNTGNQIIAYTLSGSEVRSFALPTKLANRHGSGISQPVVDSSGNIYLASYYDGVVDKFSPTGTLLWSVDPQGGNPTGLFSIRTGAAFKLVASVLQNTSASEVVNPSNGAPEGTFPLYDDFDYVTQELGGNLLFSGNGHVETLNSAGKAFSSFGANHTEGVGVHTGSGTQFYYPGQAVQGSNGTIYTADLLNTIEATSPQGFLEGTTTLGQNSNGGDNLTLAGRNFSLVGSTFFYIGGSPFNPASDNISVDPSVDPHRVSRLAPRSGRLPRVGSQPVLVRCRQLLRPRKDPRSERLLRSLVDLAGIRSAAHLLGGEQQLTRCRNRAGFHHDPAPDHGHPSRTHPVEDSDSRSETRSLSRPGLPLQHPHVPEAPARDHLPPLHRRSHRGRAEPRQPTEWNRTWRSDRSPGCRTQRTTRARRTPRGDDRLEHLPPQLFSFGTDRGILWPVGDDLLRRHR